MGKYASTTEVTSDRTRAEIEKTLTRYGATGFMYAWLDSHAAVGFVMHERQIRMVLPMPDRNSREFTHTPGRQLARSKADTEKAFDQAVRQSWRALLLIVKAKLEAVEAGIVTFDHEFGMHMVLPSGRTVADEVIPAITDAYATGNVRPLLQIGGATS